MTFRFIRDGEKPVNQKIQYDDGTPSATILRNCFAPCQPAIKRELDRWIESGQLTIQFEFDDHVVEIQRI